MQQLNRTSANCPATLPIKVMQFGGGNFLRAFVDWMIQVLNEQTAFNGAVVVVKPTERGDYADLKAQEGLFHVVLDGIKNGALVSEKKLIRSVQEVVNPYTQWQSYLDLAKNPDLRFIVSNTTEAGIKFNAKDTYEDMPPKEFPAKLTIWLHERYQYFKGDPTKGTILLPCELIENNGDILKETIVQYADHWNLDEDFINWMHTANHFCSTLVDRIVSGYPSELADAIQNEIGYKDQLLVAGEQYHSWVIQAPKDIEEELPFGKTDLNVAFVDDLVSYREMKVRILNGAHTAMVPVGYLAGLRLVKEVMDDEVVSGFVSSLLLEETITTLDFPDVVKHNFVQDVLDRFRNPSLKHQLISISLNSTSKFVARLLPTLKDYFINEDKLPKHIVFGLACLIRFYKGTFDGSEIARNDDQAVLAFFDSCWSSYDSHETTLTEMVRTILGNTAIWTENLAEIKGLVEMISTYVSEIDKSGVKEAMKILK